MDMHTGSSPARALAAARPLWAATPDGVWAGRVDGDGQRHARWHQSMRSVGSAAEVAALTGDVAIVGFASQEGVRRNHGRVGAAEAPDALRHALAPVALGSLGTGPGVRLNDAGTICVDGQDLEGAQAALGDLVADLLDAHRLVVVLGGGHESAYGSYLGRRASARGSAARTAVLNLDAHFDLRDAPAPSSGTPFLQMARADAAAGQDFAYTVLGIASGSNTGALFAQAEALGATYRLDKHCQPRHLPDVLATVEAAIADVDLVHLSIDIDVLPAAVAPGVSAPAGYGVPMEVLVEVCERVAASGKLALLDVVEVSPPYDIDGRTCRAAARLISAIVEALPAP